MSNCPHGRPAGRACAQCVVDRGDKKGECVHQVVRLCAECQQPRSFHKNDLCPHLDAAGSVAVWGPDSWTVAGKKKVDFLELERSTNPSAPTSGHSGGEY